MDFKIGDKVRRIKDRHQGMRAGDEDIVIGIRDNGTTIDLRRFSIGHSNHSLELVTKGKQVKEKPDDMVRYMSYGTGCDNKRTVRRLRHIVKRDGDKNKCQQ